MSFGGARATLPQCQTQPAVPVELGSIMGGLREQEYLLDELNKATDELRERLASVIRPVPPVNADQCGVVPSPVRCDIGDIIATSNVKLALLAERLREMRRLVDL